MALTMVAKFSLCKTGVIVYKWEKCFLTLNLSYGLGHHMASLIMIHLGHCHCSCISLSFISTEIALNLLTYLPLVPHICVRELGQHWFR